MTQTFINGKAAQGTLFIEKGGCNMDDFDNIPDCVDIRNFRVNTHGNAIKGKDGNHYFISFHLCRDRKQARTTHKITGQPLKHIKYDVINPYAIAIDTQYDNAEGCWRNSKVEKELYTFNYSYNQSDLLKIVNYISVDNEQYNRVVFADEKAINVIPTILDDAGFRESNIISFLDRVERIQADRTYLVYRYYDQKGDYFDYEYNTRRIVG